MTPPDPDTEARLIAEQWSHALDLLRADLKAATARVEALECQTRDFETRIRDLTNASTQFKIMVSLATGGGLLSVITLVREIIK